MRKRRSRYRYRRRRRTGPPFSVVLGITALVVALGVVAVVTAAPSNKSTQTASGPPRASAPARHARGRAAGHAGQGSARGESAQSRAIDGALRYTPFIAAGTRRMRAIALTFDDGPSPYTAALVHVLVRMHVAATFFIVGQQLRYFSEGLRDEIRHGFEVGDHTQNHAWLIQLSGAGQYAQIRDAAAGMERFGAPAPRLFRPPYGAYNGQTIATLRRLKMLMVLWSIDPGDWRRPGVKAIVANVLSHARPGAIVIMHDGGGDRSQTIAALPSIIRGLRRRSYRLVTVAQMLALDPPPRHQQLPHGGAA